MTPSELQHAYDVFAAALELPYSEQSAFVNRQCGGDEALAAEIGKLLEKDAQFSLAPLTPLPRPPSPSLGRDWVGRVLGPFRILRRLGGGGMGDVYLAERQEPFRQLVAIKILKRALVDAAHLQRFQHERQVLADLSHSLIVKLLDGGETDDGSPYLVMEYVEGPTLAERVEEEPMRPSDAVILVRDLANAVAHAHDRGILHRDLKPANILLGGDGRPRVTDFGLAKNLHVNHDLSHTGMVLGTPNFMAPEQAQGRVREIGPAADVYGLGAVLYYLLTGRPPFLASTLYELLRKVVEEPPTPPQIIRPHVPASLSDVCLKCLHKDPRQRYASLRELERALANVSATEGLSASDSTGGTVDAANIPTEITPDIRLPSESIGPGFFWIQILTGFAMLFAPWCALGLFSLLPRDMGGVDPHALATPDVQESLGVALIFTAYLLIAPWFGRAFPRVVFCMSGLAGMITAGYLATMPALYWPHYSVCIGILPPVVGFMMIWTTTVWRVLGFDVVSPTFRPRIFDYAIATGILLIVQSVFIASDAPEFREPRSARLPFLILIVVGLLISSFGAVGRFTAFPRIGFIASGGLAWIGLSFHFLLPPVFGLRNEMLGFFAISFLLLAGYVGAWCLCFLPLPPLGKWIQARPSSSLWGVLILDVVTGIAFLGLLGFEFAQGHPGSVARFHMAFLASVGTGCLCLAILMCVRSTRTLARYYSGLQAVIGAFSAIVLIMGWDGNAERTFVRFVLVLFITGIPCVWLVLFLCIRETDEPTLTDPELLPVRTEMRLLAVALLLLPVGIRLLLRREAMAAIIVVFLASLLAHGIYLFLPPAQRHRPHWFGVSVLAFPAWYALVSLFEDVFIDPFFW